MILEKLRAKWHEDLNFRFYMTALALILSLGGILSFVIFVVCYKW